MPNYEVIPEKRFEGEGQGGQGAEALGQLGQTPQSSRAPGSPSYESNEANVVGALTGAPDAAVGSIAGVVPSNLTNYAGDIEVLEELNADLLPKITTARANRKSKIE